MDPSKFIISPPRTPDSMRPEITEIIPILKSSIAKAKSGTFKYDNSLPALPLPTLAHSLQRWLKSVEAMTVSVDENNAELRSIYEEAARFATQLEHSQLGAKLQQAVAKRGALTRNYIADWWDDAVYLADRRPVGALTNPTGTCSMYSDVLQPHRIREKLTNLGFYSSSADDNNNQKGTPPPPPPSINLQLRMAALLLFVSARVWLVVRHECLVPHRFPPSWWSGVQQSMHQFAYMFNSSREPGVHKDEFKFHFATHPTPCPQHFLIGCRGRQFKLQIMRDERPIPIEEIEEALRDIQSRCSNSAANDVTNDDSQEKHLRDVTLITHLPRAETYELQRNLVQSSALNRQSIIEMQSAIGQLILSESEPNINDILFTTYSDDLNSRFMPKTYSITVFANGNTTFMWDHAPIDGLVVGLLTNYLELDIYWAEQGGFLDLDALGIPSKSSSKNDSMLSYLHSTLSYFFSYFSSSSSASDSSPPREILSEIMFESVPKLSQIDISGVAERANYHVNDAIKGLQLRSNIITNFNRKTSRRWKCHPDTLIQLAIQLTYMRLDAEHRPASTYETASSRKYFRGRTETIRSCTPAAVLWMKRMISHGPQDAECKKLFWEAHKAHNDLREECENGAGYDRHFLALQMAAMESGVKAEGGEEDGESGLGLFQCRAWRMTGGDGNFKLSTSSSGRFLNLGNFPPMVREGGYGTFYAVSEDRLKISISCYASEQEDREHNDNNGLTTEKQRTKRPTWKCDRFGLELVRVFDEIRQMFDDGETSK